MCIHKCINMYECTSVVIRDFYVLFKTFPEKKISKYYIRVFTTVITINNLALKSGNPSKKSHKFQYHKNICSLVKLSA